MSRKRNAGIDGVLVIDKPAGMTSHDVVDRVRRRFGTRRVGHAGTLDPGATGVLILGLGRATRFLSYAQASPKRYLASARFGATTTTQDASGEVLERREVSVGEADIRAAAQRLTGDLNQIPPMVSAVRVGGERLYEKARRGEEIERVARPVTVYELRVVCYREQPPEAVLDVRCSAGTYIRTLVHDMGASLGCGAHLWSLRRTEAGGFTDADAIELDAADEGHLRPLADAVRELRRIEIEDDAARLVADGRRLEVAPDDLGEGEHLALIHGDELVAVYSRRGSELVPERVVAAR